MHVPPATFFAAFVAATVTQRRRRRFTPLLQFLPTCRAPYIAQEGKLSGVHDEICTPPIHSSPRPPRRYRGPTGTSVKRRDQAFVKPEFAPSVSAPRISYEAAAYAALSLVVNSFTRRAMRGEVGGHVKSKVPHGPLSWRRAGGGNSIAIGPIAALRCKGISAHIFDTQHFISSKRTTIPSSN